MATAVSSMPIDPSKNARFPVTISEQLLRDDAPRKRRKINVELNHKPDIPPISTTSTITPSADSNGTNLTLSLKNTTTNDGYLYTGTQQPSSSLALLYNPSTQSFTLTKIDTTLRFNLNRSPTTTSAATLAMQYPHLPPTTAPPTTHPSTPSHTSNPPHDPNLDTPDPTNPYDYRHFHHHASHTLPSPSPAPSTTSTPIPNDITSSALTPSNSTPAPRPTRPPKPQSRPKPRPRHLSPNPGDADNEASDNDVLTIDMGSDVANSRRRPWRSVLGALNEGRRNGPISLRSAASSMSPSVRGDSEEEEQGQQEGQQQEEEEEEEKEEAKEEEEEEEEEEEVVVVGGRGTEEEKEKEKEEEEGAKSDADVEEIDLGDPQVGLVEGAGEVETPGAGWADEDSGDLEAEFEQALMSEAEQERREEGRVAEIDGIKGGNEILPPRAVEESSEESEEE